MFLLQILATKAQKSCEIGPKHLCADASLADFIFSALQFTLYIFSVILTAQIASLYIKHWQ